jgi:hypothetical protein
MKPVENILKVVQQSPQQCNNTRPGKCHKSVLRNSENQCPITLFVQAEQDPLLFEVVTLLRDDKLRKLVL